MCCFLREILPEIVPSPYYFFPSLAKEAKKKKKEKENNAWSQVKGNPACSDLKTIIM